MYEIDIWRAARVMIDLYDLDARWNAGMRADHLLDQGDVEGLYTWLTIVKAIKELQKIEPCDKDMRN